MAKFAVISEDGLTSIFYSQDVHGQRMRPVYGPTPEPSEEQPHPIPPVLGQESNPDCLIPPSAIEISDDQWTDVINNRFTRRWDGRRYVEYTPPPPAPVIPDRLSRRQFRLQLIDSELLNQVESWIATQDIRTQAAYADSGSFLRTDEMLQAGFEALGFSAEQIDDFFTAASIL